MGFQHVSSKGVAHYLHETTVKLGGGAPQRIYFFAREDEQERGRAIDLPGGWEVAEDPRNGLLVARAWRGLSERTRDEVAPNEQLVLDPLAGEGLFTTLGYTVDPKGQEFFVGDVGRLFVSPLTLSHRLLVEAVRDPGISEQELQEILEDHPELIPGDYFEARPQIVLDLGDETLRPDFMLQPVDDLWDVLEIKRPQVSMIARAGSHIRFSQAMAAAIQQVRDYSAALDDPGVRQRLLDRYGIEAYRPRMVLIAGRSKDLDPRLYRRLATEAASGIQMYTWDQVVEINRARGRLRL